MPKDTFNVAMGFLGSKTCHLFSVNYTRADLEEVKVSREGTAFKVKTWGW
jgi:hypothetical protein